MYNVLYKIQEAKELLREAHVAAQKEAPRSIVNKLDQLAEDCKQLQRNARKASKMMI